MTYFQFKFILSSLLLVTFSNIACAWGPGECTKAGQSTARCCEHEAYWCHGGSGRAISHCNYCSDECIKIPSASVCVWGGTWPSRHEKCRPGLEWFKACTAIPNNALLTGGAYEHVSDSVSRKVVTGSAEMGHAAKLVKEASIKLDVPHKMSEERSEVIGKLPTLVRTNRRSIASKVAFIISLMTEVPKVLHSAVISNTLEAAKDNVNRAISAMDQLMIQASELCCEGRGGRRSELQPDACLGFYFRGHPSSALSRISGAQVSC